MKIGIRTPSLKKSFKARTTGRAKRAVKRSINPAYGKKGMGWVNDPKKAAYNKVYNKTTVSAKDLVKGKSSKSSVSVIGTAIVFITILLMIMIIVFIAFVLIFL